MNRSVSRVITVTTVIDGQDGAQGFGIVASVLRDNFNESHWATYAEIGHTETWNYTEMYADGTNSGVMTSSIRNGCRIGDYFTVFGTAKDTGNGHMATFRSTTDSGNLKGVCVSHEIARAGADGSSPWIADLDNEMVSVACDYEGKTTAAFDKTVNVNMWHGSSPQSLTKLVATLGTTSASATGSTNSANATSGNIKMTVNRSSKTVRIEIANAKEIAQVSDITITIACENSGDQALHLYVNGVRPGNPGEKAVVFDLIPSASSVKRDKSNTLTPSSLTCDVRKTTGSSPSRAASTDGTLYYRKNGDITSASDGTSLTINTGSVTLAATDTYVTFAFFDANGTLRDKERVIVVYDGTDGNEGKGYKAVVYRENFTEAYWGTYGTIGREESWNYTKVNADGTNSGVETKDARNGCRVGDWFVVVGTAKDTGYYHVLTYECDNSSGNLHGKCINHQITKDGQNAPYDIVTYGISNSRTSHSTSNLYHQVSGDSGWYSTAPSATTTYPYVWEKIEHYTWSGGTATLSSTSYVCLTGAAGPSTQGKMGRFLWYAGLLNEVGGTTFSVDDYQAPYVNIGTEDEPRCYAYVGSNGTNLTFPSTASSYTPSNGWEDMTTDFKYLIAKAIFSSYAQLGGFIVNKDYFLSQYGTLITPEGSEITINASNVKTKYNLPKYILYGNNRDGGRIIRKVSFTVSSTTIIGISAVASSEENYDIGAVGALDSTALQGTSLSDIQNGTNCLTVNGKTMYVSGTQKKDVQISVSAGTHFFYIVYAKDGSYADGDDKITFAFSGATFTVDDVSVSEDMTSSVITKSVVPYAWFDPSDPVAETAPVTGYKFRPTKCVNALTGEEWMAGGNVHVSQTGDITMQNAVIEGSLMYHKTIVDKAGNYIRPFTMWSLTGVAIDIDGSATVENITMQLDTIIIAGNTRTNTYYLFNGIIATGYTVLLPPAKFFPGMRVRIVNGTFSGGSGNAATLNLSAINLAVIYRSDTEELADHVDISYDANMIAAALPVTFNYGNDIDFTFVGAPDSVKHIDYTPTTADHFTVFGLRGSTNKKYKSIELAALENPYVSGTHYCWMIIDVQELIIDVQE